MKYIKRNKNKVQIISDVSIKYSFTFYGFLYLCHAHFYFSELCC